MPGIWDCHQHYGATWRHCVVCVQHCVQDRENRNGHHLCRRKRWINGEQIDTSPRWCASSCCCCWLVAPDKNKFSADANSPADRLPSLISFAFYVICKNSALRSSFNWQAMRWIFSYWIYYSNCRGKRQNVGRHYIHRIVNRRFYASRPLNAYTCRQAVLWFDCTL